MFLRKKQARRLSIRQRLRAKNRPQNAHALRSLVEWLIPPSGLFHRGEFHGNIKWSPESLASQALIWAWQDSRFVTDAFSAALEVCEDLGLEHVAQTYTAFQNALSHHADLFASVLRRRLQGLMQQVAGRHWRIGKWVPIAFDGSRTTAARTVSNEKEFCAPNYGRGKTAKYRKKKSKGMRRRKNERNKPQPQHPQVWITLLWHMGVRLPRPRGRQREPVERTRRLSATSKWRRVVLAEGQNGFWREAPAIAAGASPNRQDVDVDRSLAQTMRALRSAMRPPRRAADQGLLISLSRARVQRYRNRTDKKSRYRPRNPDKKPLGDPKVRRLSRDEIDKLRELERQPIAA